MAFEKGQSGNPGGRPKEKAFADALRLAVNAEIEVEGEKKKKLRVIAERLVAEAMAGEGWAVQQVADRLDGKPAQAVVGGDDDDNPIKLLQRIERVIVNAPDPNG